MIVSLKQKEMKFKTRVKLNRNICTKFRVFFPFIIFKTIFPPPIHQPLSTQTIHENFVPNLPGVEWQASSH